MRGKAGGLLVHGCQCSVLGDLGAQERKEPQMHLFLFQSLPRQPFKQGKSLEEPSLPPPEGAPRLVPETQREPREKNGEAWWLWPEESGPFPPNTKEERQWGSPSARELP